MTMRICVVEADKPWKRSHPAMHLRNLAPAAVWDCRVGTPVAVEADNLAELQRIATLPPDLRALRFDWFADPRLHLNWRDVSSQVADACRESGIDRLRLVFINQEHTNRDRAAMTAALAPLAEMADFVVNWNDCDRGDGWWGRPYQGKVGTASCPQLYEASDTPNARRVMATIRANAPLCVPNLPICERRSPDGKHWLGGEFDTPNIYARTRKLIMDSAYYGVSVFNLSEYMIPNWEHAEKMATCISRALTDADIAYPLAVATGEST